MVRRKTSEGFARVMISKIRTTASKAKAEATSEE